MEERRQFMLDQILLPEAKERLARIGKWVGGGYKSFILIEHGIRGAFLFVMAECSSRTFPPFWKE